MKIGDTIALEIQSLRQKGKIDPDQGLLRIDYRKESAQAPFYFDMVHGKLHCRGCAAIPRDSQSALYAVWDPGSNSAELACKKCCPVPTKGKNMAKDTASDIMFGFLSILDQFGSVLIERGREYSDSDRGREVKQNISNLFSELDQAQQEALNLTLSSLDGLLNIIKTCTIKFDEHNNKDNRE